MRRRYMGRVLLLAGVLALPLASLGAEVQEKPRAKDAAEAVHEGDVSNWLKYYQREREQAATGAPPTSQAGTPASAPGGASPPQPSERR